MISVEEARELIQQNLGLLPEKEIHLHQVHHHYAAADIHAPYDHPLFDNSAVDGYAFAFETGNGPWKVVAEIAAGDPLQDPLGSGECARIFTGALMPAGADTVVMQEYVTRNGNTISHADTKLVRGGNVRLKGEQVKVGQLVLPKGERISAAATGLLASVGIKRLKVHEWPYVTIVITGNEFADNEPSPGKIFSSNDLMLVQALGDLGIRSRLMGCPDEPKELENVLRQALTGSDVVITTGGVSVGDHDLVRPILEGLSVIPIFHKVAQKPGKPMLFARKDKTLIFGLPGNPRAVLVLFWEYVLPAIQAMMGCGASAMVNERMRITESINLKGERSEFHAARIRNGCVEPLRDEGSHMLRSLIEADALIYFPAHMRHVPKDSEVEVHRIPGK